ncbi:hypothetical protein DFJ58DRAFT_845565 [Suillus subalutaceus]|uniref:uncharacterized protein n=1 Tax=Suillus subalutaceus TaxID=48586 RepID=UPI001B867301|nr:uncharacterized protein DFJ58DRAFT_845565 [Suillus subalutaceus]KAG1839806.1 hypothetical protein DFJ58DRAFT_845565 [Suillus subalutaceus]
MSGLQSMSLLELVGLEGWGTYRNEVGHFWRLISEDNVDMASSWIGGIHPWALMEQAGLRWTKVWKKIRQVYVNIQTEETLQELYRGLYTGGHMRGLVHGSGPIVDWRSGGMDKVTGHWNTKEWKLWSELLSFSELKESHSRVNMGDKLYDILKKYNVTYKTQNLTSNNVTLNDKSAWILTNKLKADGVKFIENNAYSGQGEIDSNLNDKDTEEEIEALMQYIDNAAANFIAKAVIKFTNNADDSDEVPNINKNQQNYSSYKFSEDKWKLLNLIKKIAASIQEDFTAEYY